MIIDKQFIEKLVFRRYKDAPRFTQDSPVYPDVWLAYFEFIGALSEKRLDLILTPHHRSHAAELFKVVYERLAANAPILDIDWRMASNGETIAVRLTFFELLKVVLPLSGWLQVNESDDTGRKPDNMEWLDILVGTFLLADDQRLTQKQDERVLVDLEEKDIPEFARSFYRSRMVSLFSRESLPYPLLYSVSRNRAASISVTGSVPATKADASRRLFEIDGSQIAWAVLDTGIDARHAAFRKTDKKTGAPFAEALGAKKDPHSNHTRIIATYDFTRFRDLLANIHEERNMNPPGRERRIPLTTSNQQDESLPHATIEEFVQEISKDLRNGRLLDWTVIAPLLRIPHNVDEYKEPEHPHGTHVAGILGACEQTKAGVEAMIGMCPGIALYDIRVLDRTGRGDEFNILAALQFVRWMNNQKEGFQVHGVNLSFSVPHEVASYACGQTPVCEACERLVAEGTVVVAAAGNLGQTLYTSTNGDCQPGFRMVNITDPGNAEAVITVGSTHRNRPHAYGVSYFSSKGPTGDGRVKPDLVAPGEKITSTVIGGGVDLMDGTSMAAPHVSGAAALLLAKHRELIGRPRRVKEILCKTATDLGREKYFQGCGMVDVLRAIQSV